MAEKRRRHTENRVAEVCVGRHAVARRAGSGPVHGTGVRAEVRALQGGGVRKVNVCDE